MRSNSSDVTGTRADVKFNPIGNVLVTTHALLPLSKAGLRSHITMVFGVDYAF
jgi:hypothetical protein